MDTPYSTNEEAYREYAKRQLESGKWDDLKLKDAGCDIDAFIGHLIESGYEPWDPNQPITQKEALAGLGLDQLSPEELKELGIELYE